MKTIVLTDVALPFDKALRYLFNGKCLGIKPESSSNYIVLFKPAWMNKESPDYILKWNNPNDMEIRTDQFLGVWFPVIVDHRTI